MSRKENNTKASKATKRYMVAIHKVYFPAGFVTERFETFAYKWIVMACGRSNAAAQAWRQHASEIEPMLRAGVRHISLHVSGANAIDKKSQNRSLAGRMDPIRVR